jgi:hypothetical protein
LTSAEESKKGKIRAVAAGGGVIPDIRFDSYRTPQKGDVHISLDLEGFPNG